MKRRQIVKWGERFFFFHFCFHYAYVFLLKLAILINLLVHYTKGTLSQPELSSPESVKLLLLQLIVSIKFQVFSNSQVLFTFPSRYFPLSVIKKISLWGRAPIVRTKLHVFRLTCFFHWVLIDRTVTFFGLCFHIINEPCIEKKAFTAFVRHYLRCLGWFYSKVT